MKQCERCGIDEDDPRARQACASVDSPSPYHLFSEVETCPRCKRRAVLSDASERSIIFDEPLCAKCRASVIHDLSMDSFDVAYERARANGWAD